MDPRQEFDRRWLRVITDPQDLKIEYFLNTKYVTISQNTDNYIFCI